MPVYKDKRDGTWRYRVQVRLPDGRKIRLSGTPDIDTQAAARRAEANAIESAMAEPASVRSRSAPTVAQWIGTALDDHCRDNKPSTIVAKRQHLEHWITPTIGAIPLDAVSPVHIATVKAAMPNRAPNTVNNVLRTLSWALNLAIELEVIERMPKVRLLANPRKAIDYLRANEVTAIYEARGVPPRDRLAVLLGLDAGLRMGEVGGLQWGDIDGDRLHVQRANHHGVIGTTKASKDRWLPMNDRLQSAVAAWRAVAKCSPWMLADKSLAQDHLRPILRRVCKLAGIRQVSFHVLRHTFCSRLVMAGVDIATIRDLAGHADIQTTARYLHVASQAGRAAVDKL
jgi:integrase